MEYHTLAEQNFEKAMADMKDTATVAVHSNHGSSSRSDTNDSASSDPTSIEDEEDWFQLAQDACCLPRNAIADVYPASHLQRGLVAQSIKGNNSYIAQWVLDLEEDVDVDLLQAAWTAVVAITPTLRTRFIESATHGVVQVVTNDQPQWTFGDNLPTFLKKDKEHGIGLGDRTLRLGLVQSSFGSHCIITAHHALYDGASMLAVFKMVEDGYNGHIEDNATSFRSFIQHLETANHAGSRTYWRAALAGCQRCEFPRLPHRGYHPVASQIENGLLSLPTISGDSITPATVMRAAWALVVHNHTNPGSPDIDATYGATVSGRSLSGLSDADSIVGPLMATIPIRLRSTQQSRVREMLSQTQAFYAKSMPHEQLGLEEIKSLSEDAAAACDFQSLLVIQGISIDKEIDPEIWSRSNASMAPMMLSQALVLELTPSTDSVYEAKINFDPYAVDRAQVQLLLAQFEQVVAQLFQGLVNEAMLVSDIEYVSLADLDRLTAWHQQQQLVSSNLTLHDLLSESMSHRPESEAVVADDLLLSHSELDRQATRLAARLQTSGLTAGRNVLLSFEKNPWAIVGMLAILKAGCAFVPVDPSTPPERAAYIAKQVDATFAVTSPAQQPRFTELVKVTISVDGPIADGVDKEVSISNTAATADSTAVILFTSGSTGTPKGVVMTHSNVVAAVLAHSATMQLPSKSRVLHFSSLTFDHIVWEIFTVLYDGNTICVPTELQRNDALEQTLKDFEITVAYFTPSLASTLQPEHFPQLNTLYVGGETVPQSLIDRWTPSRRLYIGYGPTEASLCTGLFATPATRAGEIGRPINTRTWIVDTSNATALAPIGVAGELYCEGPMIAAGYIGMPELTKASFVIDPPWSNGLMVDSKGPNRFYRTGDLVRYRSDGSLEFLGREDGLVKIRGQRVEIHEIEHHLRTMLPPGRRAVVSALSRVGGRDVTGTLSCFIEKGNAAPSSQAVFLTSESDLAEFATLTNNLSIRLQHTLPPYMIPSIFLPVQSFPVTATGKTDIKALSKAAAAASVEQLASFGSGSTTKAAPKGHAQLLLQRIWSVVLGIDASHIGANDHFLRIGGNSISAMRMIALVRRQKFELSVRDVFRYPILSDLARAMTELSTTFDQVAPFHLIGSERQSLVEYAAATANVQTSDIEDIFPTTPLQEGFIVLSSKTPGTFVAQTIFTLPAATRVDILEQAFELVAREVSILRTRFFQTPSSDLMQAVLKPEAAKLPWTHSSMPLDDFISEDKRRPVSLGEPFVRFAVLDNNRDRTVKLVISLHHATYDGWSIDLLYARVAKAYAQMLGSSQGVLENDPALAGRTSLNAFVTWIRESNQEASRQFWKQQLAACPPPSFPPLPSVDYLPSADYHMDLRIALPKRAESEYTVSTMIRAAWAIVTARYSDTPDDIVFGATLNGRSAPVTGIETVIGPTMTTVPIRVVFEDTKTTTTPQLLNRIQSQAADIFPHEQFGLQEIRNINDEARAATNFQNLLLVEVKEDGSTDRKDMIEACLGKRGGASNYFYPFAMTMQCFIDPIPEAQFGLSMDCTMDFDSAVLDPRQMRRFLRQFKHVLAQLWEERSEQTIDNVVITSPEDREEIERWNSQLNEPSKTLVHDLFTSMVDRQPNAPACASWEGELTFKELDTLSSKLANKLMSLGIGPCARIPMMFEKSIWTIVATYGVLKSGNAVVYLGPTQPEERLAGLVEEVEGPIILASAQWAQKAQGIHSHVLQVDSDMLHQLDASPARPQTSVQPANSAFILFTSGSTGKPKGINITHISVSSAIRGHAEVLRFSTGPGSRNLNFTAYVSDVNMPEIATTLAVGSCVCVPSEWERMNDIAGAMERLKVNWAFFTPSVAALIDPNTVPTLRTLVFGGETATPQLLNAWCPRLHLINSFGPAECTVWTHANPHAHEEDLGNNIGFGLGYSTWITEPGNHDRLAPIGAVGELCVEGPALAQGYINNPVKTAEVFVSNPGFLPRAEHGQEPRRMYRLGDLARYLPNGMVQFLGRRDDQIKLAGQRIELGEVEHQVRSCIPGFEIACEAIRPGGNAPILGAFIAIGLDPDMESDGKDDESFTRLVTTAHGRSVFADLTRNLHGQLTQLLPLYMVPSVVLPLYKMPMTGSSKVDRKKLRQLCSMMTRQDMDMFAAATRVHRAPTTSNEKKLHEIWKEVLKLKRDVSLDENFIHLGGDSLKAMKVVLNCQKAGLQLSLAAIFNNPTLGGMASSCKESIKDQLVPTGVSPFSLLPSGEAGRAVIEEAASQSRVSLQEIEDVYPTTPLQSGMFALSQRASGSFVGQFVYRMFDADRSRLEKAWETTVARTPLLRTSFVQAGSQLLHTCFKDQSIEWRGAGQSLDEYLASDLADRMRLGDRLTRFALVNDSAKGLVLVVTMHHAVYDGWAADLLFDAVDAAYHGRPQDDFFNFNAFVGYLERRDQTDTRHYWRNELADCPATIFPHVDDPHFLPAAHAWATLDVPLHARQGSDVTISTVVRATWALVLAEQSGWADVVFGASLNGRTQPVRGLQRMIGPAIATVPVRIKVRQQAVDEFLHDVQQHAADMFNHEQYGIQNIRDLSDDARRACNFLTLLVIQTAVNRGSEEGSGNGLFRHQQELINISRTFHNYAIALEVTLGEAGVELKATYDESVVSSDQVEKMLARFSTIAQRLWGQDSTHMLQDVLESDALKQSMALTEGEATQLVQQSVEARSHRRRRQRPTYQAPRTLHEKTLHRLWAQVLHIDDDSFGVNDDFFVLGGDSIKAMALVNQLGKIKRQLSVEEIFLHPDLSAMAACMRGTQLVDEVQPFELLLSPNVDAVLDHAATHARVPRHSIEDIFPCTAFQESMMALSIKTPGSYVAHFAYRVPPSISLVKLRAAWKAFFSRSPVLRTRLVPSPDSETGSLFLQVVTRQDFECPTHETALATYLEDHPIMGPGDALARFAVVQDHSGQSHFVMTFHHAVYDGVTINNAWHAVEQYYVGEQPEALPDFRHLIKSLLESRDDAQAQSFWSSQLQNSAAPTFPRYPNRDYVPHADSFAIRKMDMQKKAGSRFTTATLIRACWAILLQQHCDSSIVQYLLIASGRARAVAGIANMDGPVVTTLPIHMAVDPEESIDDFLTKVQQQSVDMTPHEQDGLPNIRRWASANQTSSRDQQEYRSMIVIQTTDESSDHSGALNMTLEQNDRALFAEYPLVAQWTVLEDSIEVGLQFDEKVVDQEVAKRLLEQAEHLLTALHEHAKHGGDLTIGALNSASPSDRAQISQWNHAVLAAQRSECLHEMVQLQARKTPFAPAIASGDGDMSYQKLVECASVVAQTLRTSYDVGLNDMIPLSFDKSQWFVVAALGVLMAGAAYVPLDPNHPVSRRDEIVAQVSAKVVLAATQADSDFRVPVAAVNAQTVQPGRFALNKEPNVKTSDLAYVLFTSGSTGKPKGVQIEHHSIVTSILEHGRFMNFGPHTRALQLAPYTFDVAVAEIFTTLCHGGTICIPSTHQRLGVGLVEFINTCNVTSVCATPSYIGTMSPDYVPGVKAMVLGGEPIRQNNIDVWAHRVRLMNGYGPTEASVLSAVTDVHPGEATAARSIGRTLGSCSWIVDPENHDRLMPIGAAGELLLQGPTLARGYLGDPEKTAKAFIQLPAFLADADVNAWGPRCYKTGDLVRYLPDGNLEFLGRGDAQVKVNGQRLELGEIEHHARLATPGIAAFAAEVVKDGRTGGQSIALFFVPEEAFESETTSLLLDVTPELQNMGEQMKHALDQSLPGYMVPSLYIPLSDLPLRSSGKVDRTKLAQLAASAQPSAAVAQTKVPIETDDERFLQRIWSEVLSTTPEEIGRHDSFFRLGGDSILAIKMLGRAREAGRMLTPEDVFKSPILSDLALQLRDFTSDTTEAPGPFSLVASDPLQDIRREAAAQCGVAEDDIEDILPPTPLQSGVMMVSVREPGSYIASFPFTVSASVDQKKLSQAWISAARQAPILRTRFVNVAGHGMFQVVLRDDPTLNHVYMSLSDFQARRLPMSFGDQLTYASIVHDESTKEDTLVYSAHHSVYDDQTIRNVMRLVEQHYQDQVPASPPPFSSFIKYLANGSNAESEAFWRTYLSGVERSSFPQFPTPRHQAKADASLSRHVKFPRTSFSDNTISTVLRAAWGLVLSMAENSKDVVYGTTVSGRNAPVPGIEDMAGPLLSSFPLRVAIDPEQLVAEFLDQVQASTTAIIPHEQIGLAKLQGLDESTAAACEYRTHHIITYTSDSVGTKGLLSPSSVDTPFTPFFTYPLVMTVLLSAESVELNVQYDHQLLTAGEADRLLSQYETAFLQLYGADVNTKVKNIDLLSESDVAQLKEWNNTVLDQNPLMLVTESIRRHVERQPHHDALLATAASLTYEELWRYSGKLATSLLADGLCHGERVALYFEKTVWAPVAMLAVMRAGGVFFFLDPKHPQARQRLIVQQANARRVVVGGDEQLQMFEAKSTFTASADALETVQSDDKQLSGVQLRAKDGMYVSFTSGSTGVPKGVEVEHGTVAMFCDAYAQRLPLNEQSRLLNFSAFVFDVALADILSTLAAGASLLLPVEEERVTHLADFMIRMQCTAAVLNPTVAEMLDPRAFTHLQTLGMGGQAPSAQVLEKWRGQIPHLLNFYGPTEATVWCASGDFNNDSRNGTVVRGQLTNLWIVDPDNHDRLLPPGAVGELVLEGPCLSRGYINAEQTRKSYIEHPKWEQLLGRPVERIYKTRDLAKVLSDGAVRFLGRADTQVKIRGQRVEPDDVEHTARQIVEGTKTSAYIVATSTSRSADEVQLVAFITNSQRRSQAAVEGTEIFEHDEEQQRLLAPVVKKLQDEIADLMPAVCLPALYIPIKYTPVLLSDKVNRKALREALGELGQANARALSIQPRSSTGRAVSTPAEVLLGKLWASILKLQPEEIHAQANFLRLGGDSMAAMKLVADVSKHDMFLSVRDVFSSPVLEDMARCVGQARINMEQYTPFETVSELDKETLLERVADQCQVKVTQVEDVMKCTPFQEVFAGHLEHHPGASSVQNVYQLDSSVNLERFKKAWEATAMAIPQLRTRFVKLNGEYVQVVCSEVPQWREAKTVQSLLDNDCNKPPGLGEPVQRVALITDARTRSTRFVLTINHAIYDGWSMELMLQRLEAEYQQMTSDWARPRLAMGGLIKHISTAQGSADTTAYWTKTLEAASVEPWLDQSTAFSNAAFSLDRMVDFRVRLDNNTVKSQGITPATLANAAWAVVGAKLTGQSDVALLLTLTGRDIPLEGIENLAAPTITQVPVRVSVDLATTGLAFLETVQKAVNDALPHAHLGASRIAALSPSASKTVLGSQPLAVHTKSQAESQLPKSSNSIGLTPVASYPLANSPYLLSLDTVVSEDEIYNIMTFDSKAVSADRITRLCEMFVSAVAALQDSGCGCLGDVKVGREGTGALSLRSLPIASDVNMRPWLDEA